MAEFEMVYRPVTDCELPYTVDGDEPTFWMTPKVAAELVDRDVKTIYKHLAEAVKDGELDAVVSFAKFATQTGGKLGSVRTIQAEHLNLEAFNAILFRVKSKKGIEFRKWANKLAEDPTFA